MLLSICMVVIPLKWTTSPVTKCGALINENEVLSSIICGIESHFMMYTHHLWVEFEWPLAAELALTF